MNRTGSIFASLCLLVGLFPSPRLLAATRNDEIARLLPASNVLAQATDTHRELVGSGVASNRFNPKRTFSSPPKVDPEGAIRAQGPEAFVLGSQYVQGVGTNRVFVRKPREDVSTVKTESPQLQVDDPFAFSLFSGGNCVTPPSGMVGWWTADNNAQDISGYGNHGNPVSIGYQQQGAVANAFSLDGQNSEVVVPPSGNLNVTSFTIDAWIFPTENPTDVRMPIVEYANEHSFAGIHFWTGDSWSGPLAGSLWANLRDVNIGDHVLDTGGNVVTPGDWNFVAITYDYASGYGRIYANGQFVKQTYLGQFIPQTSTVLHIGARPLTSPDGGWLNFKFDGSIDEVEVFNRALSESELNAIYYAGSAGKCKPLPPPPPTSCVAPPSGMVGWWTGDNNAQDISGQANHGNPLNVTYQSGKVQNSFDLDGSNSSITVPQSSSLTVQSFTIDAWIFPEDDVLQPIVEYTDDSGWAGIHLWMGSGWYGQLSGALWANLRDVNVGDHVLETPAYQVPINAWSFVAVTYDASTGQGALYLNGLIVDSGFLGFFTPKTGTKLRIGERPAGCWDGGLYRFQGQIDEVEVFNRALSSSELLSIYNAGPYGKCKTGSNPDTDGDGLLDSWEMQFFGNLSQSGSGDPDGDGLSNLWEQSLGLNPVANQSASAIFPRIYGYDLLDRLRTVTGSASITITPDPESNIVTVVP